MPDKTPRPISQLRIATDLGFSQSLVSKVLNGHRDGIPDATVDQIWSHAREHGYRPRGINHDLFVADTVAAGMVGFVLRSPLRLANESHIFHHALQGMHEVLVKKNIRTVFLGTESDIDPAELRRAVQRHQLMRGLVLMGEVKPAFMNEIARCEKPVVLISARYPGLAHSVLTNLTQSGELLVNHLHGLGHRRFGWIGSSHSLNSHARHRDAYVRALAAHGLELDPRCEVVVPEASRHHGHTAAAELLERNRRRPPTAIICFNAMIARAAMNLFFQRGLQVPRDLSVAAFDMTQVCVEEKPYITGASALPESLGAHAAQLILARSAQPDPSLCEVILPAELATRDTTGRAPAAAPTRRRASAR